MKMEMECSIKSQIIIESEITIEHNNKTYVFVTGESNFISTIKIIAPIEHPDRSRNIGFENAETGIKLAMKLAHDEELYQEVLSEFLELESLLSLRYRVRGIDWRSPKYRLIFETQKQRSKS